MAKSNTARASEIAHNQHTFFKLNARYLVAPDATADGLMNDAACLIEAVHSIALHLAMELSEPDSALHNSPGSAAGMLFGAAYLAEMAQHAAGAATVYPSQQAGGVQ